MKTFVAGNRETQPVQKLANDIEKAQNRADPFVALTYLSALPARPQDGLYLFAAAVTAPGDPRGLYRYDSSTGSYINI